MTSLNIVDDTMLDIGLSGADGPGAIALSFPGIAATYTGETCADAVCLRALPGDASGDGVVDTSDYVVVRNSIGRPVTAANCRHDVNADGAINTSDFIFIRGRIGTAAGGCE